MVAEEVLGQSCCFCCDFVILPGLLCETSANPISEKPRSWRYVDCRVCSLFIGFKGCFYGGCFIFLIVMSDFVSFAQCFQNISAGLLFEWYGAVVSNSYVSGCGKFFPFFAIEGKPLSESCTVGFP